MKKNDKKRGFTIVELVIVIAIIGILASVTIVGFTGALTDAKEKAALLEARNIYAEYQVDVAEDGKAPLENCVIYADELYFEVSNGKIKEEPVEYTSSELEPVTGANNIYTKKANQ